MAGLVPAIHVFTIDHQRKSWMVDTLTDSSQNHGSPVSVPRRVSALVAYVHPFRLIQSEQISEWKTSIEQINGFGWDYAKLHEIAGGIDVGLPPPYHLLVARDGAIALPPIAELRDDQSAVKFFNRCLAAMLLGGIYCEAITFDGLEFGSVIDWKYLRADGRGYAAANRFHDLIRRQQAPPLEAIALLDPRIEEFSVLADAIQSGLSVLADLPSLSPEFLLRGVTGIARRDWGGALTNLWIIVEQLTEHVWSREVISKELDGEKIKGRIDQLKDTRTWTAAVRQEALLQKGVLGHALLQDLYVARRARNELMHRGTHPDKSGARAAYSASIGLLRIALSGRSVPLFGLNLDDHSLSDPFKPVSHGPLNPKYWMAIRKLPGEEELEREEAKMRNSGEGNVR